MRIEIDKEEYKDLIETKEEFLKTVRKLDNITIENIKLTDKLQEKEQECEELRNKLNSNIERMNKQNEKLHNENKELKAQLEQQKKENEEFKEKLSQAKDITEPLNSELLEDKVIREIFLIVNDCINKKVNPYKQALDEIEKQVKAINNECFYDASCDCNNCDMKNDCSYYRKFKTLDIINKAKDGE